MNSASKIVRIVEPKGPSGLSKAQKLFNKLIKQIDAGRKRLGAWQETIPLYQQKCAGELDPLLQTFNGLRAELVCLYDKAYAEKIFNKSDKAKLKDIICTMAAELIVENDDEELKRIYNKHSKSDFDAEVAEEKNAMKAMMESMLGVDLGEEIDFSSPEKMMAHVGEKMREKLAAEEQAQQERKERFDQRKKSAKTLAKEAKQQEEAQNISQSIREVYRKLASALHPDKEQDISERDRKTALMQRVNVAYDNKDLLRLLELQLEVEQIDQATINTMTEDRLKYYNKILTEQSGELRYEIDAVECSFKMRFNIPPQISLSPVAVMRGLETDIKETEQNIVHLKKDLVFLQDMKNIKDWLKSYRIPPKPYFDDPFEAMELGMSFRP